jgi:hypothetical protein
MPSDSKRLADTLDWHTWAFGELRRIAGRTMVGLWSLGLEVDSTTPMAS